MQKNTNPPQKMVKLTPEYLYKKGTELYQEAINIQFEQEKGFSCEVQEKFINAVIYLQGAMLLGSNDACAYLCEFYSPANHLEISNKDLSNLIKIMGTISNFYSYQKLRESVCLKNYDIINNYEFKELTGIEQGYISEIKTEWRNKSILEKSVLDEVKLMIEQFNNNFKYSLITDKDTFEYKKETGKAEVAEVIEEQKLNTEINEMVASFTKLKNYQKQSEYTEAEYVNDFKEVDYGLTGAELCTIS